MLKLFILLILLVECAFAYKTVKLSVTPNRLSPGTDSIMVNVDLKFNEATLPSGFSSANWGGHNKWDFLGIWKEDPSHPESKCTPKLGTGWTCPSKEAYSTLSDYVYGSASLTRDSSLRKSIDTEKELTFTSSTSVYHVYYCLTPLSFKAFNYDCIARTSRRSRETSIRITSNAYRKQVPVLKSKTKVRKEKQRKNWKSLLVKTRWNLQ